MKTEQSVGFVEQWMLKPRGAESEGATADAAGVPPRLLPTADIRRRGAEGGR